MIFYRYLRAAGGTMTFSPRAAATMYKMPAKATTMPTNIVGA